MILYRIQSTHNYDLHKQKSEINSLSGRKEIDNYSSSTSSFYLKIVLETRKTVDRVLQYSIKPHLLRHLHERLPGLMTSLANERRDDVLGGER